MSITSFDEAVKAVGTLSSSPTDDEKLALYKYYKQVTVGDVEGSQPWQVQVAARAKWDAWNSVKGTSKADAENAYIALVNEYIGKYGVSA